MRPKLRFVIFFLGLLATILLTCGSGYAQLGVTSVPGTLPDGATYQFLWDEEVDFPFVFAFRADLESRATGILRGTRA